MQRELFDMGNYVILEEKMKRLNDIISGNRFNDFSAREFLKFLFVDILEEERGIDWTNRLMQRFGSFNNVVDAPCDVLAEVLDGNKRAAAFFKAIPLFNAYYRMSQIANSADKNDVVSMMDHIVCAHWYDKRESFSVLLIDSKHQIISLERISEGAYCCVDIDLERLSEIIVKNKAELFVLVHNHPNGVPTPSESDIITTKKVASFFNMRGKKMMEHFIVSGNKYIPIVQLMRLNGKTLFD